MMIGVPPLMALVYSFIRIFKLTIFSNTQKKIANYLCYDGIISFLNETILLIAICGMLNLSYLKWNTYGNAINSVICMIFLSICVVFPLFVAIFYTKPSNYQKIESKDEKFMEKFGSVL